MEDKAIKGSMPKKPKNQQEYSAYMSWINNKSRIHSNTQILSKLLISPTAGEQKDIEKIH
jgi:hypothetical protein